MKVIVSHSVPFFLTHGGMQTQIEALMREVTNLGVEVEPERWWDDRQRGDILHYFLRPSIENLQMAKRAGFKIVVTDLIGQTASRGAARLWLQRWTMEMARAILPPVFLERLSWEAYREADAMVFMVEHEWNTAKRLYRARPDRGYIIPHGLEPEALEHLSRPQPEEDYLVCMATIRPVKNSVLLARAAWCARTPVVFLGKPYSMTDPYFLEFKKLVDGKIVRYPGFVSGEAKYRWLRGARGFVLFSQFESGCIALYEAAAAGLPLLLSDLPWANQAHNGVRDATFVRLGAPEAMAPVLSAFYNQAHRRPGTTFPILTWRQVAEKYLEVYRKILARS
jgi:glycosyltransferase involved in cell wall biosynthesis